MSRLSFITNIEQFYIDLLKTSQDENVKRENLYFGKLGITFIFARLRESLV